MRKLLDKAEVEFLLSKAKSLLGETTDFMHLDLSSQFDLLKFYEFTLLIYRDTFEFLTRLSLQSGKIEKYMIVSNQENLNLTKPASAEIEIYAIPNSDSPLEVQSYVAGTSPEDSFDSIETLAQKVIYFDGSESWVVFADRDYEFGFCAITTSKLTWPASNIDWKVDVDDLVLAWPTDRTLTVPQSTIELLRKNYDKFRVVETRHFK